jgi:hypothetical protein
LILRLSAADLSGDHTIGFQYYFRDKMKGRMTELDSMTKLVVKARTSESRPIRAKIILTDRDAVSYAAFIDLSNSFKEIQVPLSNLVPDSALVLPRPYPGFLPVKFKANANGKFNLMEIEKRDND